MITIDTYSQLLRGFDNFKVYKFDDLKQEVQDRLVEKHYELWDKGSKWHMDDFAKHFLKDDFEAIGVLEFEATEWDLYRGSSRFTGTPDSKYINKTVSERFGTAKSNQVWRDFADTLKNLFETAGQAEYSLHIRFDGGASIDLEYVGDVDEEYDKRDAIETKLESAAEDLYEDLNSQVFNMINQEYEFYMDEGLKDMLRENYYYNEDGSINE